jgi:hypothetical protein
MHNEVGGDNADVAEDVVAALDSRARFLLLRFDPGADILKRFIYFLNYIFRL